jgi:hypothetical protein
LLDSDRHRHPGHADPERNQFQANEKVDELYFFPENSNILSKILKNDDTFDTKEKEKRIKIKIRIRVGTKNIGADPQHFL